jgi:MFS family permease
VWLLTLVGGALADRADRRFVITLFQSIQMLCPTAIVALLLDGGVGPSLIIALSLVVGVTDALSMPSFQSIVPSIVPRDQIARGLALNSTQFNLSRILGPAIAGVLIASAGAVACFALNAASYIPFIAVALWVLPRRVKPPPPGERFDTRHLLAGLREIARAPHLRGALLTVFATSVLCGPLVTFAPVLVSAAFRGGSGDFSIAISAFGVGGLCGAVSLLALPATQDRRLWSTRFAALYGLAVMAIALSPWLRVLPILMACAGVAMTVSNTSANSLLQATASPRLLGRTVSLFMLATRGGIPLGALLTGLSIEWLGVRSALFVNGALALALHLAIGRAWLRARLPKTAPSDAAVV